MATFDKGMFNKKKPTTGEKTADPKAIGRADRKSEAYEDYNGLEAIKRPSNEVTVGGAEILDNSGRFDE